MNIKWFLLLTLSFSLVYGNTVMMKEGDIKRIMDEIFRQHVQKKEMTPLLYKEAVEHYIRNADVDKIYLLTSEVAPYLSLTDSQVSSLIQQYNRGDYRYFKKLNTIIQGAYDRARKTRSQFKTLAAPMVYEVIRSNETFPESFDTWANSLGSLEERQKINYKSFIQQWIHRYGKARAESNPKEVLDRFDHDESFKENQYLYLNQDGTLLSKDERENLFSLHLLKAFAASLDAHTKVYDPSEAISMRMRLESGFKGIGLVLGQGSGQGLLVRKVIEDSAAAKSGLIQSGDELIEINGKSLQGFSFEEALKMVQNEPGERASLTFSRGSGDTKRMLDVELTKERLDTQGSRLQVLREKYGNGEIGVIKLDAFYQSDDGISSEKDVKEALEGLDKKNLRGLVLDLRDNRGGFLNQAVKVAGLFITNGVVVVSKYATGEEKIYRDTDGKTYYEGPLVVLVSKMTASAAEIVSQALQDYGVAIVVGDEHTYGKGTIQSQTVTEQTGLSSYFKVTVGKYYTVSGKTPQMQGVRSDIVVPGPLAKRRIGEAFLEDTLPADMISANFDDELTDVDPNLKAWYLKYYLPTLQPQEGGWKSMEDRLKERSLYRISNNADYQTFLRSQDPEFPPGRDLQLIEALNIVKDMIYFESKEGRLKNVELN